jgi:1,2-phenylacetyl-CoA epoxidase PaaB subunit
MGERRVNRLRRWLNDFYHQNKKYLVCADCHGPLYLKGGGATGFKQQLHFSHYQSEEYKNCPLNENNSSISPEQAKANQYRGVQESKRHERLKNALDEIMEMDDDCSGTIIDKCYAGREKNERRKPDVQTKYKDKSLVLEIQLSTEFITIISARETYYRSKNAFMLWIFDSFAKNGLMNQSERDIFYKNNSHAFCIDQYHIEKSKKDKKLNLIVIHNTPYIKNGKIEDKRNKPESITIDDIVFDEKTLSAYYFPYDKKYQELKRSIIYDNLKKLASSPDSLQELDSYLHEISDISSDFRFDLRSFIIYMLSAREGKDILGRDISKYISNCQLFLNPSGKGNWLFYFYSVLKYNCHDFLPGNGSEKMNNKAERYLKAFRKNPVDKEYSRFYPKKQCEELFAFLFPDEYEKFCELVTWAGIDWQRVDTEHFVKLDRYELHR